MLISLWVLLCLLLALHAYREYWHRRDLPQIYTGEFEGELMKAGTTYIARRPARNGRQYPELANSKKRPVSATLEAPVLPQARTAGNASDPLPHRFYCYLLPIFFGLSRHRSEERLLKLPMMQPTNALKTHLCMSIFCVARSYATCVANVKSIVNWQRATGYEPYRNFPSLIVVIGARDSSLDKRSMLASAKQGKKLNRGLSIMQTVGTNHFISLEQPDTIRAIH